MCVVSYTNIFQRKVIFRVVIKVALPAVKTTRSISPFQNRPVASLAPIIEMCRAMGAIVFRRRVRTN